MNWKIKWDQSLKTVKIKSSDELYKINIMGYINDETFEKSYLTTLEIIKKFFEKSEKSKEVENFNQ